MLTHVRGAGLWCSNIWSSEMFFCPKSEAGNITCPAVPEMPYPIEKDYTEVGAVGRCEAPMEL